MIWVGGSGRCSTLCCQVGAAWGLDAIWKPWNHFMWGCIPCCAGSVVVAFAECVQSNRSWLRDGPAGLPAECWVADTQICVHILESMLSATMLLFCAMFSCCNIYQSMVCYADLHMVEWTRELVAYMLCTCRGVPVLFLFSFKSFRMLDEEFIIALHNAFMLGSNQIHCTMVPSWHKGNLTPSFTTACCSSTSGGIL